MSPPEPQRVDDDPTGFGQTITYRMLAAGGGNWTGGRGMQVGCFAVRQASGEFFYEEPESYSIDHWPSGATVVRSIPCFELALAVVDDLSRSTKQDADSAIPGKPLVEQLGPDVLAWLRFMCPDRREQRIEQFVRFRDWVDGLDVEANEPIEPSRYLETMDLDQ